MINEYNKKVINPFNYFKMKLCRCGKYLNDYYCS